MATSMCMRLVRHERGELRDYGVSGPAYSLDLELHSQVSCTGAWTSEKEGSELSNLLQALLSILKIEMWRGAHLPFN